MTLTRHPASWVVLRVAAALLLTALAQAAVADIARFVGSYEGTANVSSADGSTKKRDMSVEIAETKQGFSVAWSTNTYRPDGSTKEKSYLVEFVPSDRGDVYSSAMKRNVFGHDVQLDPMKGEPYVWSRINGDTLSVYSLFVAPDGGYEIQQFNRTLTEGGLDLDYKSVRNGEVQRTVSTFLERR